MLGSALAGLFACVRIQSFPLPFLTPLPGPFSSRAGTCARCTLGSSLALSFTATFVRVQWCIFRDKGGAGSLLIASY